MYLRRSLGAQLSGKEIFMNNNALNKMKKLLAGVTAAMFMLTAAACGNNDSSNSGNNAGGSASSSAAGGDSAASGEDDSLQKVLDSGKFVLGLDASFKPMGYTDENDEIVGFDIDCAEEVCKRMGVTLETKGINWDTKEDTLDAGTIDCIWNGMSIDEKREERMNLSEPYMENSMVFVVPADSTAAAMADLADKTVAVQNGSTAQTLLEESEIGDSCKISPLATNVEALQQMDLGLVDAVYLDSVVAEYEIAEAGKDWKIFTDGSESEKYAIGFRKGDQALRDKVQEILSEMKADGTLAKISEKWFGKDVTIVK